MGTPDADDVERAPEPGDDDAVPGWWRRNAWNLTCWAALLVGASVFAGVAYGAWQAMVLGGFVLAMFAVVGVKWRR